MLRPLSFAGAAIVLMGAGCVPLTDYRKLEERYKEQEKYVQKHKDEVSEFQKREQLLTIQRQQQQKDLETALARLAKSEEMRKQAEARGGKSILVADPQPASSKGGGETFAGFRINGDTGGIVLEHDVMFESGKSTLKPAGKKVLDDLVRKLSGPEYGKYCIRIDGHTDDVPVSKTVKENHDNWELGFKRAKAVFDYMVAKGISEERCFLASFGKWHPMIPVSMKMPSKKSAPLKKGEKPHAEKHAAGDTAGRAQNRRVEIVLFDKKH